MCVTLSSKWNETHDRTMEMVIGSDVYHKQINIFAFSWTLCNISTY